MPNGGMHHCRNCRLSEKQGEIVYCSIRNTEIESANCTTCANVYSEVLEPEGPIFSIVFGGSTGGGTYEEIPYFDNCRVDTFLNSDEKWAVGFTDRQGEYHEFETIQNYLHFYEQFGR